MSLSALELTHVTHLPIGSGVIRHASFLTRPLRMTMDHPTSVQIGKKSLDHHGQKIHTILTFSQITTQTNSIGKTHRITFNSRKTSCNKTRDLLWIARRRRLSTDWQRVCSSSSQESTPTALQTEGTIWMEWLVFYRRCERHITTCRNRMISIGRTFQL